MRDLIRPGGGWISGEADAEMEIHQMTAAPNGREIGGIE